MDDKSFTFLFYSKKKLLLGKSWFRQDVYYVENVLESKILKIIIFIFTFEIQISFPHHRNNVRNGNWIP